MYQKIIWRSLDFHTIPTILKCKELLIYLNHDIVACKRRLSLLRLNKSKGLPVNEEYIINTERGFENLKLDQQKLEFRIWELRRDDCDHHRDVHNTCNLHVVRVNVKYYEFLKKIKNSLKKLNKDLYLEIVGDMKSEFSKKRSDFLKEKEQNRKQILEEINDEIDKWHACTDTRKNCKLHEWLGLSWDEFSHYLENPSDGNFLVDIYTKVSNARDIRNK